MLPLHRPPSLRLGRAASGGALVASLLLACAASPGPIPVATPHPSGGTLSTPQAAATMSVDLSAEGAFARLLTTPATDTRLDCVLVLGPSGLAPGRALAPATRDMPEPLELLSPLLAAAPGQTRVLTPWGRLGPDGDGPVLVSLSRVPSAARSAPAMALFLHGEAFELRSIHGEGKAETAGPTPMDDLSAQLSHFAGGPHTVFVTAAGAVTDQGLLDALARLPSDAFVVLASALPAGTRLPGEPQPDPEAGGACDALPAAAPGLSAGDLPVAALREGIAPLPARIRGCIAATSHLEKARVTLAMRIAEGRALDACLMDGATLDPVLSTCIVAQAKQLQFDSGAPGQFVEVALPLSLAPEEDPPPAPVCRTP